MISYPTRELSLEVAGMAIRLHEVIDTGALLDALIAKGDHHEDVLDERIPYWAELWPAALGLGQFLIRHQCVVPGMEVTEIGCGLGLPGIIAGKLGARVVLSDYLPEALALAGLNWAANFGQPARLEQMDWRQPNTSLSAELLLASDITYEKRFFEYLPPAFRALCRPGGRILLSDPRRQIAGSFFESLPKLGFDVRKYEERVWFRQRHQTINIYALSPGREGR